MKRQQSTGKQYIRIRSDGGIDYAELDDDYSCRVRRPNNLVSRFCLITINCYLHFTSMAFKMFYIVFIFIVMLVRNIHD